MNEKINRRDFLKKATKTASAVLATGVLNSIPKVVLGKENKEDNIEGQFYKTKSTLEMATEFFLEGKRINLEPIRRELNRLQEISSTNYSNYTELLEGTAEESNMCTISQISNLLNEDTIAILEAIENKQTGLEEHVFKLEDLKERRRRLPQDIIQMAQLYALSNKRGNKEYGINFVKSENEELVTITEALHGQNQSVGLDISDELMYGPDYEIFSLHTHPDEFSFFSIKGDLTYYLSNVDSVDDLKNFTAQMVDRSAIVWNMKFSEMSQEQLDNIKNQDLYYTTFLITNILILNNFLKDNEKDGFNQLLLQDEFRDDIKERILNVIKQINNPKFLKTQSNEEIIELKKIKLNLENILQEMEVLPDKIKDLIALQKVAIEIVGVSNKDDFVKNALKIKSEFKKHGIKVFSTIPGRIKKKWNK